jgi:hypothetical protein
MYERETPKINVDQGPKTSGFPNNYKEINRDLKRVA